MAEDMNTFKQKVNNKLASLPEGFLDYDENDYYSFDRHYKVIFEYAYQKQLMNTIISLHIVRGLLLGNKSKIPYSMQKNKASIGVHLSHCLNVARSLIDICVNLTDYEEDIVLAAAISHILVELYHYQGEEKEEFLRYGLDEEVINTIQVTYRNLNWNEYEKRKYYNRIQENKLALLLKLADRANILEQLYEASMCNLQENVSDTKKYFLPMCIYGKEHYKENYHIFTILLEKMKCLLVVTEMLANKHIARMNELNDIIFELMEDNARIRKMIHEIEEND